jgi:hypothetical protein
VILFRYAVRALGGPRVFVRQIAIATLSVVQTLLQLLRRDLVADVRRIKESLLLKTEAETALKQAEVAKARAEGEKVLAEAAELANRASLRKRKDNLARAEAEKKRAEAAKTRAEAEAIRMDAEGRHAREVAEAGVRISEALSKLRLEGGEIMVDSDQLRGLLALLTPRSPSGA